MKKYSEEFDAYYDDELNIWLETRCTDKQCLYCGTRPDKPLNKD